MAVDLSAADHAADRARRMAARANRIRKASAELDDEAAREPDHDGILAGRAAQLPSTPPAGGPMTPPAGSGPTAGKQSMFSAGFAMALEEEEGKEKEDERGGAAAAGAGVASGTAERKEGSSSGEPEGGSDDASSASRRSDGEAGAAAPDMLLVSTDEALERLCRSIGKLATAAASRLDELRDEPKHMAPMSAGHPLRHESAPGPAGHPSRHATLQHKHTPVHLDAASAKAHPLL